MRAVLSTTQAAESLLGGSGGVSAPAYLACADGKFQRGMAPAGAKVSRPTKLCLIVLAQGYVVTVISYPSHYPKLSTLGTV